MFEASDVIHSYSRAEALADGYLVDVSETAREAGFVFPVAMTRAAWENCVTWGEAEQRRKGACQDEAGRLWDVLWMARSAAKRAAQTDRLTYTLLRVPREGRGRKPRLTSLQLHIGPGDTPEPVITIMMPGED